MLPVADAEGPVGWMLDMHKYCYCCSWALNMWKVHTNSDWTGSFRTCFPQNSFTPTPPDLLLGTYQDHLGSLKPLSSKYDQQEFVLSCCTEARMKCCCHLSFLWLGRTVNYLECCIVTITNVAWKVLSLHLKKMCVCHAHTKCTVGLLLRNLQFCPSVFLTSL